MRSRVLQDSTAQCPMSLKFGAKSGIWDELLRLIQALGGIREFSVSFGVYRCVCQGFYDVREALRS